jgi:hypothetical protein
MMKYQASVLFVTFPSDLLELHVLAGVGFTVII